MLRGASAIAAFMLLATPVPVSADHDPDGPLWFDTVVADGFAATPFALGTAGVTSIAFSPDGDLYAATIGGGIVRHRNVAGIVAGPPEPVVTGFPSGFSAPQGIAFGPDGTLYVASIDPADTRTDRPWGAVFRFAVPDAGPPLDVEDGDRLLIDVPGGVHGVAGLSFGPDGKLYVGQGSTTTNGYNGPGQGPDEVPNVSLAVLRFDPSDAAEPLSALRYRGSGGATEHPVDVVATGLHTPQDLAFRGDDLYTAFNGPHEQTPLGEEPVVRVVDAPRAALADGTMVDFGSPRCLYTHDALGRPVGLPSTYEEVPDAGCDGVTPALAVLGLHRGTVGVAFAPEGLGAFSGDLFIAMFGSLPEPETPESLSQTALVHGHKVVRVGIGADGTVAATPDGSPDITDFLAGGGPIDIAFRDGVMYVADVLTSAVYRVAPIA